MTRTRAITLHQPYATLVALGVKRIETRSWAAPAAAIGERLLIHAAARVPRQRERIGDWTVLLPSGLPHSSVDRASMGRYHDGPNNAPGIPRRVSLPLGKIVASATLTACVPMVAAGPATWDEAAEVYEHGAVVLNVNGPEMAYFHDHMRTDELSVDVSDQRPYGDFAPGRWAWLLDDIEACDPIPAKGYQRIWWWDT